MVVAWIIFRGYLLPRRGVKKAKRLLPPGEDNPRRPRREYSRFRHMFWRFGVAKPLLFTISECVRGVTLARTPRRFEMRLVIARALVLSALCVSVPMAVYAQDPEPAPTPAPAPAPAPPRDTAVPRAERAREADRPARQPEQERARRPDREAPPADVPGSVRREAARETPRETTVRENQPREIRTGEEGSRRRERVVTSPEASAAVAAPAAATSNDEQNNRRPGSVRRPPSEGRGSTAPRDRAVARTGPPPNRDRDYDRVYVYPDYWSYGRYYDPYYNGFYLGYLAYSPWGWTPAFYGSPYSYGYGGGYYQAHGYDIGRVRLKVTPRDAEVFVDGYFAGQVDDFDGIWQSLRLDSGGYRIEIRKPGFETLVFDVRIQPDRTITYRGELTPAP
jgi:hypothetical protein